MDEDSEFEASFPPASRCPDECPNANAPYCPMHEDPAIYRRDDTKMHLQEAYAHNAAREMICQALDRLREKRRLKEIRVPLRTMDEWLVFTRQVVLDSGEYTAQGEVERRIAAWLDKVRDQDWAALDRLKERYMRFTPDWRGERPADPVSDRTAAKSPDRHRAYSKPAPAKRAARRKSPAADSEAAQYEDEM